MNTYETCTSLSETVPVALPRLERVLDRSMMALLLGLFSTDLLAKDMSAVTRVMDILQQHQTHMSYSTNMQRDAGWTPTERAEPLTCHQTCASGSQTALSASCLSPAQMNEDEEETRWKEERKKWKTRREPCYKLLGITHLCTAITGSLRVLSKTNTLNKVISSHNERLRKGQCTGDESGQLRSAASSAASADEYELHSEALQWSRNSRLVVASVQKIIWTDIQSSCLTQGNRSMDPWMRAGRTLHQPSLWFVQMTEGWRSLSWSTEQWK